MTINYEIIKFLDGISPGPDFERDLNIVKSYSKEKLAKIIDFTMDNYASNLPISKEEFEEYAKKIGERPAVISRAVQFILFVLPEAIDKRLKVEDFENDLMQLGLNECKDIFVDKFNYYKNKVEEKLKEKEYRYFPYLTNSEWRIGHCLGVSKGKKPEKLTSFITIEYISLDGESSRITFEADIPRINVLKMNLELCLEEAKKWQEKI